MTPSKPTVPTVMESIGTISLNAIKDLEMKQQHPEKYRPISFEIEELTNAIGGIVLPSYVAVGGPAKTGKTTVLTHIAQLVAMARRLVVRNGIPDQPLKVFYFHLEELKNQFAYRMLTMGDDVTTTRTMIRDLTLTEENFTELHARQQQLDEIEIYMCDNVFTVDKMIEICLREGAQVMVIDTINLADDGSNIQNEAQRLSTTSQKLIAARNNHGLTSLVAYQLNDDGKALNSRALYRDPDLILEISVPRDSSKEIIDGQLTIEVKPSRQGKANVKVNVAFSGDNNRIGPLGGNSFTNFKSVAEKLAEGSL